MMHLVERIEVVGDDKSSSAIRWAKDFAYAPFCETQGAKFST